MTDPDQLPALPEPVLEGVDYELWGQNAKWDCYSKGQMQDYALTAIATERARADALQAELTDAKTHATSLATSIHAKHFAEVAHWRPLSDVLGLLTQIDNMTFGVSKRADALEAALRELCYLKRLKDWMAKPGSAYELFEGRKFQAGESTAEYNRRKPLAWAAARALLEKKT